MIDICQTLASDRNRILGNGHLVGIVSEGIDMTPCRVVYKLISVNRDRIFIRVGGARGEIVSLKLSCSNGTIILDLIDSNIITLSGGGWRNGSSSLLVHETTQVFVAFGRFTLQDLTRSAAMVLFGAVVMTTGSSTAPCIAQAGERPKSVCAASAFSRTIFTHKSQEARNIGVATILLDELDNCVVVCLIGCGSSADETGR